MTDLLLTKTKGYCLFDDFCTGDCKGCEGYSLLDFVEYYEEPEILKTKGMIL